MKESRGLGEDLSSYTTDIRKQCSRLNLPPWEWLHHFVKGLRKDIKEYVALREPTTFEQAENFAKLKEVMSSDSSNAPIDTKKLSEELIQHFKNSGLTSDSQERKPKLAVAAATPSAVRLSQQNEIGGAEAPPFSLYEGQYMSTPYFNTPSQISEKQYMSMPYFSANPNNPAQCSMQYGMQNYDRQSNPTPDIRKMIREELQQHFKSQNQSANRSTQSNLSSGNFVRGR